MSVLGIDTTSADGHSTASGQDPLRYPALCTIVTVDFLHKAVAMATSLQNTGIHTPTYVITTEPCALQIPGLTIVPVDVIANLDPAAKRFVERYDSSEKLVGGFRFGQLAK